MDEEISELPKEHHFLRVRHFKPRNQVQRKQQIKALLSRQQSAKKHSFSSPLTSKPIFSSLTSKKRNITNNELCNDFKTFRKY